MLGCLLAAGLTLLAAAASAGTARHAGREAGNLATPQPKTGLGPTALCRSRLCRTPGSLSDVCYSARAAGASFFFTKREAVFSLARTRNESLALRLRFVGANPRVEVAARKRRAGRVDYLHGQRPLEVAYQNVPDLGEVVYRDLWPGIDLVFGGEQGRLKYELHVAPGASETQVRLAYSGASGLSLDRGGNLRIRTVRRHDQRRAPCQLPATGRSARTRHEPVPTHAGARHGFALAGYDRSRPLVIDPGLAYSAFLGGRRLRDRGRRHG